MPVSDRATLDASLLRRVPNIYKQENDLVVISSCIARASREVRFDAQQREVARARAPRRRQEKLKDHVNIVEAIRIGAPICDVNPHLVMSMRP